MREVLAEVLVLLGEGKVSWLVIWKGHDDLSSSWVGRGVSSRDTLRGPRVVSGG